MIPATLPMLHIHNTSLVPPGGWKYVDPDTGHRIGVPTYPAMLNKVAAHRRGNALQPLAEATIQHILCRQASEGVCGGDAGDEPPIYANISGADAINGTKVIFSLVKSGGRLVKPEVAEVRAKICSACPQNVDYNSGCSSCATTLAGFILKIAGKRKTTMDANLKACGVCHCMNKAQVHVPYRHLKKGMTPAMNDLWPKECWKNPKNNE